MLFSATLMRVTTLLVSATALISASAADADEPNFGAFFKARYSASTGDYIQSAQYFEEAIEADPNNLDLLSVAHQVFVIAGEFDQAVAAARSLNENGAADPFIWLTLIVDEVRAGDFESALELHQAAMFGNLFLGDLLRGWLHVGAGNTDAALEVFGKEFEQEYLAEIMNSIAGWRSSRPAMLNRPRKHSKQLSWILRRSRMNSTFSTPKFLRGRAISRPPNDCFREEETGHPDLCRN